MTMPYLLQLCAGAEGLNGESVRSGTHKREEERKNQDVKSYEERRKIQEKNGSAVVGGDEDGERRRWQRRQGRGSEQEGEQGSTMRSHLPNCLLPLWGKFAVAPGGTGDGPGGTIRNEKDVSTYQLRETRNQDPMPRFSTTRKAASVSTQFGEATRSWYDV
ncbi:hypothetical protein DER44DRAFT_744100 [Fusarium oxysporum]|nr:hypothetical protein DER44DRAFT_744100 [Fusarium oxysporum]